MRKKRDPNREDAEGNRTACSAEAVDSADVRPRLLAVDWHTAELARLCCASKVGPGTGEGTAQAEAACRGKEMRHDCARPGAFRWVAASACILVLGVWLVSGAWHMRWHFDYGDLSIGCGELWFNCCYPVFAGAELPGGGRLRCGPHSYWLVWRLPWAGHQSDTWTVRMPLWAVFVGAAIPTVLLWWRACRRMSDGCCGRCGYNLTGNVNGICPECGTPIPQASDPKSKEAS